MASITELQAKIDPHISRSELSNILQPDVEIDTWETKKQRDLWMEAVLEQGGGTENLRAVLVAVVRWKNEKPAICLWAGHVQKAEEEKSKGMPYTSAEDIEAALIERIATPTYVQYEYSKPELAKEILPVIRSSAITQLRPEIWEHEKKSLDRVESVCDEYVDGTIGH